jgi:ADP-dependent NAD(P)H-hydrate dehydratase / NAD(P)H-hydrate epimerase
MSGLNTSLPLALYSAEQVRELDRRAITAGISAATLMERAAAAAFDVLRIRWPRARRINVVCGSGNNGGDGFVLARLAHEARLSVTVLATSEHMNTAEANAARQRCISDGVRIEPCRPSSVPHADVVVDALFGTGLRRALSDETLSIVNAMNTSSSPVLALDVPSGLNADTGATMGGAVNAAATVAFIGLKAGLYTSYGREHAGDIYFDDLEVPPSVYDGVAPVARRIAATDLRRAVEPRTRHGHKGDYGKVLVIGGDSGMSGAARLAGEAAYRAGAGLVVVATHPSHAATLNMTRPELLVHGVQEARELHHLITQADVVAIGPGLGKSEWGAALFGHALDAARGPLVLDADALNLLALDPQKRDNWVLTPHPGEAGRLLGITTAQVQVDRFRAIEAIVERYGGVCVLKGSGTLIKSDAHGELALCDRGNPGLASGGTGDVLTGVVAGLLAQGQPTYEAARIGVWVHATAGDSAARDGEVGMLASDLLPGVKKQINRLVGNDVRNCYDNE